MMKKRNQKNSQKKDLMTWGRIEREREIKLERHYISVKGRGEEIRKRSLFKRLLLEKEKHRPKKRRREKIARTHKDNK